MADLFVRDGGPDAAAAPPARAGFADALRGFALFGICVVNSYSLALPDPGQGGTRAGLNAAANLVVAALFENKFFPLFSFLFGFGAAVQFDRIRQGRATGAAYARRLIGLGVLGALHAVLLYPGDILFTYAVAGALLWRVRHRPDRSLLRRAGGWVAFAALCTTVLVSAILAVWPALAEPTAQERLAEQAAAVRAHLGPFGDLVLYRLRRELPVAAASAVLFYGPFAFGAFCAGLVAGRRGLLHDPHRLKAALRPYLPLLCAGALVGNAAAASLPWLPPAAGALESLLLGIGGPCLTALYVLLLARLWGGGRGRRVLGWLEPAGRMALTNYLGQSLVANALFMGWGLGLYGKVPPAALLVVAPLIAGGLAAVSWPWLRRFRIGPVEWLLRSWTVLHRRPPRRAVGVDDPRRGGS